MTVPQTEIAAIVGAGGGMSEQKKKDDPYFVEVDTNGCGTCGKGRTWTVIGPTGVAASQSWEAEEDANAFADALNEAFWRGRTEPSRR